MTTHQANQRLSKDLKVVMHDAEELLKATAGEAGEKFKHVRERLGDTLMAAKHTCERIGEKTVEAAEATDQVIRKHPYESIGVAFGIGILIGVFVGRR